MKKVLAYMLTTRGLNVILTLIIVTLSVARQWRLLAHMSGYFMNELHGKEQGKPVILVLAPFRFRSDLALLAERGARVVELDFNWMRRLVSIWFPHETTMETVFFYHDDPIVSKDRQKFHRTMQQFLPVFNEVHGIDVVLAAAVHYRSEYLWGSEAYLSGSAFVIFHRECFKAAKFNRDYWTNYWSRCEAYHVSHIVVHNEACRDMFVSSGIVTEDKCSALGVMRMDAWVDEAKAVRRKHEPRKQVTFFSFVHGVCLPNSELWFSEHEPDGFRNLFHASHTAFIRFAKENPYTDCIIKTKWAGGDFVWEDEIALSAKAAGIDTNELPNLLITANADVHELIINSRAVVAFGSTTMLEAGVCGRPVIMPYFEEAALPEFKEKVILGEEKEVFHVAYSPEEMINLLEKAVGPEMLSVDQKSLDALFGKWVSPVTGGSAERYMNIIQTAVGNKGCL